MPRTPRTIWPIVLTASVASGLVAAWLLARRAEPRTYSSQSLAVSKDAITPTEPTPQPPQLNSLRPSEAPSPADGPPDVGSGQGTMFDHPDIPDEVIREARKKGLWHLQRQYDFPSYLDPSRGTYSQSNQKVFYDESCQTRLGQTPEEVLEHAGISETTSVWPLGPARGRIESFFRYFVLGDVRYFVRGVRLAGSEGLALELLVKASKDVSDETWYPVVVADYGGEPLSDSAFYSLAKKIEQDYLAKGATMASRSMVLSFPEQTSKGEQEIFVELYNNELSRLISDSHICTVQANEDADVLCRCPSSKGTAPAAP